MPEHQNYQLLCWETEKGKSFKGWLILQLKKAFTFMKLNQSITLSWKFKEVGST